MWNPDFTGLSRAEKFPGPANQQIRFGNLKTVVGADHRFQAVRASSVTGRM